MTFLTQRHSTRGWKMIERHHAPTLTQGGQGQPISRLGADKAAASASQDLGDREFWNLVSSGAGTLGVLHAGRRSGGALPGRSRRYANLDQPQRKLGSERWAPFGYLDRGFGLGETY